MLEESKNALDLGGKFTAHHTHCGRAIMSRQSHEKYRDSDSPDPSSDPTAYTISRGWKASELVRGMNGECESLGGGIVSTVDSVESASDRDRQ